jgi:dTDP-4-dehydrorhamnose 3,5-epimerase
VFKLESTGLPGVHVLHLPRFTDSRGAFVKLVHASGFSKLDLRTDFSEQFFTVSQKNVLRGMHCQLPPHDHAKLVTCVAGEILDVVVDLRRSGPTFGHSIAVTLNAEHGRAIYIPPGCAHGFLTLSNEAITHYNVTSVHAPASDTGVHWQSVGFAWPVAAPLVSERDKALPPLGRFSSPF